MLGCYAALLSARNRLTSASWYLTALRPTRTYRGPMPSIRHFFTVAARRFKRLLT